MKKIKKNYRRRVVALTLAVMMLLPIPNKSKKEIITIIGNLYYKYFKNAEGGVIPVSADCDSEIIKDEISIIDEQESLIVINDEIEETLNEDDLLEVTNPSSIIESENELKEEVKIEVNNVVLEENEIIHGTKQIAFTFDDGPSVYTEELLEILRENNASATFFVIGSRIDKYGSVIEKMKNDNHQIGSHGTNHQDFTKVDNEELKKMLEETETLLANYGVVQTLVRPPYGSINNRVKENIDYPLIMWSLDTRDWEHRSSESGAQIIIENIEDGSIILMHDLYKSTIDAVRAVLPILKEQGYEFVTVNELFGEIELEKGKTYYKKIK